MKVSWHIEKRKITELKDHPKNPRILTKEQEEQISKSLEKFGLVDKPAINLDGTIIGGHQRVRILKKLKEKEIECLIPSRMLDEKEVEELNIRLNKNTGDWDWDILANEWEITELLLWGFNAEELLGTPIEDLGSTEEEKEKDKKSKVCPNCGVDL